MLIQIQDLYFTGTSKAPFWSIYLVPHNTTPNIEKHFHGDMPDEPGRRKWSQAKRAVQPLLEDYSLNGTEVEILDPT